ncbi:MAG: family 78 glycoside hydrolase catalytic domain [Bacteroidota bacterium]
MKNVHLFFLLLPLLTSEASAQGNKDPWVSYPSANMTEYGVYHFRKSFDLEKVPEKLVIQVSADNRYNLFVNGQRVCYGPAKGDLKTYKYDVVDIAKYVKPGKNVLAALVYNGGIDKPLAFISVQTAFMLRSENPEFAKLNTDSGWKVIKNPAYQVISYNEMLFEKRWFYGFYACGGGDDVDGTLYPWGWEQVDYDDSLWLVPEQLSFGGRAPWNLVPRNIAFMDNHREQPARIREAEGVDIAAGSWSGNTRLSVPAHTKASVLVDFGDFTMGYPELTVEGGANSSVKIKYAEALYEGVNIKAHRDSVNGKTMYGVWDIFRTDGKAERTFRPLWKRAFRYVQLVIETRDQPLDIVSFENEYSGYPYPEMGTFTSDNSRLNEIFEMSLRTLRLCSGETYYDTPYYEQLSYGGDNRPISSVSTYNSTDDRLLREVMRLYPQSVNSETGLFKSAYPSRFTFDMGGWSMAWIQSLHDYYFMRGDSGYIRPFVQPLEGVLGFYERHLDERTGLIGSVSNQSFIDWSITSGSIPRANDQKEIRQSALLTLYYAHTLDCAVRLLNELGLPEKAKHWENISEGLKVAVYINCWDGQKKLFRDYPDQQIFSQHTNLFAILCDVVTPAQQAELLKRILTFDQFDEMASSYFSFFLFKAMQKTGQEELFLDHLGYWYTYIDRGLTTCGETGFASHDRSDCHAWSAHPASYLLSIVCGINPAGVGFNEVRITPHLGDLKTVKASMPHPKGRIEVNYKVRDGKLDAMVVLPGNLNGEFEYKGKITPLSSGRNEVRCEF